MNDGGLPTGIRDAAQQWLLRLQSRDCTAGEREAFERWRAADPRHDAAYRAVESVWQRSAAIGTDPALGDLLRQARRLPPERAWWRRNAPKLAAAACLALAVGAGYRFLRERPENIAPVEYATATGQQRTVALDDGSQVVLDTGSSLQVQYGKRERRLTLRRGQADFQVRHDTARPFVVHTAGGTVTATGTRFQVRVAGDTDTVTLLQGQVVVAVDNPHGETGRVTLQPGERVALAAGGIGTPERLPDTELASAGGWTEGMLVVREWPLERLVTEMNRYTDTPLRLGDPGLGALPMSGRFKASDQQSFLMSLEYSAPVRVDRTTPGQIVLRRKPGK